MRSPVSAPPPIIILGGTAVVSTAVEDDLKTLIGAF